MANKEPPGLTIQYFRTGLYTRRSQLFAPIRTVGINVVQMRDALIDGSDMEVTDLMEVQRRPGFSRFCSQQLAAGEIINQFDSVRTPTGTVIPLFDSNQRVASFSTSAITTIWTKAAANQAFDELIGTQLYLANGTTDGQKRYDTGTAALHGMGILGPVAMPTVTAPTAAGTTFWQPNTVYGATIVLLLDPNGNIQINGKIYGGANLTTGAQPPVWNNAQGGFTADGTGTWGNLGPPGQWQASHVYTFDSCIIDSNGNFQTSKPSGTSAATQPAWTTVIGTTVADNTVTWTCRGPATPAVFAGFFYVYTYSTQAPTVTTGYYHCSTASPVTYSTGVVFETSYSSVIGGAYSTNLDVGSVDIYRTKDGGSVLCYAGSVVNNTAGGNWTFTDTVLDSSLLTQTNVPLNLYHRNDVPPGTTGSIAPSTDKGSYLKYWNGRMWMIAGNKVYFSAGADCQNGDPNASWPPANVFAYPGQPIALTPTSAGLLVWLTNSVKIIAGGPATLQFFSVDLLQNFGISSPNCVDKDGDTIRVISTQGQQFTLTVTEKIEEGTFVADLIAANFAPSTSYITTHRNGLDSGVFIANGESKMMRYGLNIGAWSTTYNVVGSVKAIRSIETSVGKYTLCAGRASTAGYILGRDLTTYQDDGANYANCFVTVGNMVLSALGQPLTPVHYIMAQLAATGSLPAVSFLANEISGTSGLGFINVPRVQDEPTTGAAASTTLLSKQWELRSMQTMVSLLMHHLQVKFQFPAENFPNTLKTLSLKYGEDG